MKNYIDTTMPFMDKKEVCAVTLKSKSQLQLDINEGLFPPQIKIGGRRAVYLSCEVNEMIGFWICELNKSEVMDRVKLMVSKRALNVTVS